MVGFFLCVAFALSQVLIGVARLLFFLPAVAATGLAAVVAVGANPSQIPRDRICSWSTAIFVGYLVVRAFFSPSQFYAWMDVFSVLAGLVIYLLAGSALTGGGARKAVFLFLLALVVPHVIVGAIQFRQENNFMPISFLQRPDYQQRASGFYICPNHLAGLLEVVGIFGMSITCWSRSAPWLKLLVGYVTAICYVGLALTGSRGGYLSVAGSVLAFSILSLLALRSAGKGIFRVGAIAAIICVLILGGAILLLQQSDYLTDRARKINDPHNLRLDLWHAALQQWKLSPIIGTGAESYRFYGRLFRTARMQNDPVYVHNDYLQLLADYGVIGAAAFLFFLFAHLRQGWNGFRRLGLRRGGPRGLTLSDRLALNIGALAAVVAYIIHSALDFNLHIPANVLVLALVFGILATAGLREIPENQVRSAGKQINRYGLTLLGLFLIVSASLLFPGLYDAELARAALRDEHPAEAVVLAQHSLRYTRQNPELFFTLGRALVATRNEASGADNKELYKRAIDAFRQGHELTPLDVTFPTELAYTYDQIGDFAEAERMFGIAKRLDPRSTSIDELYKSHLLLSKQTQPSSK